MTTHRDSCVVDNNQAEVQDLRHQLRVIVKRGQEERRRVQGLR